MQAPLVATQRGSRLRAEIAVERAVVDAVPRQQELQHRDVESEHPGTHDAVAEQRATERPERGARPIVGESRYRQVRALLSRADRGDRLRSDETVDRARIE